MKPPAGMGHPAAQVADAIERAAAAERAAHPLVLVSPEGGARRAYPVGAGVAALVYNPHGEFLLIQRGPDCSHGAGTWSFPGGWMEEGERPWETAVRETYEEVGLAVLPTVADVYPATSQHFPEQGVHSVCLMVRCHYPARDLTGLALEPGKVSDAIWATPAEARRLDLFGHVRAYLDGRGGFS